MKTKKKALSAVKAALCALLLLTSLFPIYWLLAMAIQIGRASCRERVYVLV